MLPSVVWLSINLGTAVLVGFFLRKITKDNGVIAMLAEQ